MSSHPAILFTAFEPSGDAHAAPVIKELLAKAPNLKVYAWGGPLMEKAGATILERSADDGTMGFSAFKRIMYVRKQVKAIRRWAQQVRVLAHVPVDSPAANFPIAKVMKKSGAGAVRVIHLVAPQLWAWGRWRLGKLRRNTDGVLCLLPFEEQWFNQRDIPAKFIGHPIVNRELDTADLRERSSGLPQGAPRVAIFPGSRTQEVKANIGLLVAAFAELQARFSGMSGVVVAANGKLAELIRKRIKVFPTGMHMVTGLTEPAIYWCDLALAVSGTISLDIARQGKPMVAVYKTGILAWLLSKVLLRTPFCLLPNIIAEREISPEFIPHIGGPSPIVSAASPMLLDSRNAAIQSEELKRVISRFATKKPAEEAARLILHVIKHGVITNA